MNTNQMEDIREKIRIGIIDGCLQIIDAEDVSGNIKFKAISLLNDAYASLTEEQKGV